MPNMILEDIKGTQKYIGDIGGTMVKNVLEFFKPWMALKVIGKHNRTMLGDIEKGSIFFAFGATRATKKDIKMARMSSRSPRNIRCQKG